MPQEDTNKSARPAPVFKPLQKFMTTHLKKKSWCLRDGSAVKNTLRIVKNSSLKEDPCSVPQRPHSSSRSTAALVLRDLTSSANIHGTHTHAYIERKHSYI